MPKVRFAYTTEAFSQTVEYWKLVGLPLLKDEPQFDHPDSERTAWFDAGGEAVIEVIESATVRPADGSWIAIEVEDVDGLYERLMKAGFGHPVGITKSRGERSVLLREPNGVGVLYFSTVLM
jgi:hypothetical protein